MWIIELPLRIRVTKKKERYFSLNLNEYRNAHHFTLHKAKELFTELVLPRVKNAQIPKLDKCELEYKVFFGTRQRLDTNNVCCIVDKFFSDVLVMAKIIPDDNYKHIVSTRFSFGAVDRENPRVEVTIRAA